MRNGEFTPPEMKDGEREEAALPHHPDTQSSPEGKITPQQRATLMAIEGVEGVGVGQDAIGNEAVVVYVRDQEAASRIPPTSDGMKVVVQVTGQIDAQD